MMKLPLIQHRNIYFAISGIAVLISLIALSVFGLKPGIDFTGGSLLEVSFTGDRPSHDDMQALFSDNLYGNVLIQTTDGNGYILKMRYISEEEHQAILSQIRDTFQVVSGSSENNLVMSTDANGNASFDVAEVTTDSATEQPVPSSENRVLEQRLETIGPSISSQLKKRSIEAAIAVVIAIVAFVAYAFRKVSRPVQSWKYGLTAIIALLHDVIITMGVFAFLGKYLNVEVDIPFVVALLTILGYSVNDTIVVFDRIRENLIKHGSDRFDELVNKGVNETFVRSINTSLTTLLVLFALFLFGGDSIHYFSLALIIGIFSGTYSSIFLASPLLVVWQKLSARR